MGKTNEHSEYWIALQKLGERVALWEAMSDHEIGRQSEALQHEHVTTRETHRGGGGTLTIRLRCIQGLTARSDDAKPGKELTFRLYAQQHRAMECAKTARIRADALAQQGTTTAKARWSRLDDVKAWAFEERRADPRASRAAVVRKIAPQVRLMAKDADEPLSGDDHAVIETITRWFRKAGIK
jgi:hypothetical protein